MANSKALLVFALVFLLVLAACQSFVQDESPITGRAITTTNVEEKTVTSPAVNIEVKPAEDDPPISTDPDPDAVLPQNHEWQIVLRNYLATFEEADFEIPLDGDGKLPALTFDEGYFGSQDNRWRFYSAARNRAHRFPNSDLFRAEPQHFLLENIESGNQVSMWSGKTVWDAGVWLDWDNPGNPHFGRQESINRLKVAAIVNLIMDYEHGSRRHDFMSGWLITISYAYTVIKDDMPSSAQAAYEQGLLSLFEDIEQKGPTGTHADMDVPGLLSMWYVAQGISDPHNELNLLERYEDYAINKILYRHYWPAGYVDHGDGFDPSYNGVSIDRVSIAAAVTGLDFYDEVVDGLWKLRAHLSFKEPDGAWNHQGPTHFATTMSPDSWNDQDGSISTHMGAAFSEYAYYPLVAEDHPSFHGVRLPEEISDSIIHDRINRINTGWDRGLTDPSDSAPPTWSSRHWLHYSMTPFLEIPDGVYEDLLALRDSGSPHFESLYLRDENFVRSFPALDDDTEHLRLEGSRLKNFLIAKYDDYSVVVHTGRLSWWGAPAGMGGGALSAFWTEDAGSAILGRVRQRPLSSDVGRDAWNEPDGRTWRIWATHTVSGENNGGGFSFARNRGHPSPEYVLYDSNGNPTLSNDEAASAFVITSTLMGPSDSRTMESGNLQSNAYLDRSFDVSPEGITITTMLTSDGTDQVNELWEMIPAHHGVGSSNVENANTKIYFESGGQFSEATTALAEGVTRIRIERFGSDVYIIFSEPRNVKLSPHLNDHSYGTSRNIMVDLLGNNANMPVETSVNYIVSPYENAVPS